MAEASPVGFESQREKLDLAVLDAEVGRENDDQVERLVFEHLTGGGIVGDRSVER